MKCAKKMTKICAGRAAVINIICYVVCCVHCVMQMCSECIVKCAAGVGTVWADWTGNGLPKVLDAPAQVAVLPLQQSLLPCNP